MYTYLTHGEISIGTGANMIQPGSPRRSNFFYKGTLNIDSNASLTFSHNVVSSDGGAVHLRNGELIINTNAKLNFTHNSARLGGAVYLNNLYRHAQMQCIFTTIAVHWEEAYTSCMELCILTPINL